jgi:hypothetical protein
VGFVELGLDGLLESLGEPFFFFFDLSVVELPAVAEALRPWSVALLALGGVAGVVVEGVVVADGSGGLTAPGVVGVRPGTLGVPGLAGAGLGTDEPGAPEPGAPGNCAEAAPASARLTPKKAPRIRLCIRMGELLLLRRWNLPNREAPCKSSPKTSIG